MTIFFLKRMFMVRSNKGKILPLPLLFFGLHGIFLVFQNGLPPPVPMTDSSRSPGPWFKHSETLADSNPLSLLVSASSCSGYCVWFPHSWKSTDQVSARKWQINPSFVCFRPIYPNRSDHYWGWNNVPCIHFDFDILPIVLPPPPLLHFKMPNQLVASNHIMDGISTTFGHHPKVSLGQQSPCHDTLCAMQPGAVDMQAPHTWICFSHLWRWIKSQLRHLFVIGQYTQKQSQHILTNTWPTYTAFHLTS